MHNTSNKIKLILLLALGLIIFSSNIHAQSNAFLCSTDNIDKILEAENIQLIDITTAHSKKWSKNYFRAIKSGGLISKQYKKKFTANIKVRFDNELECTFPSKSGSDASTIWTNIFDSVISSKVALNDDIRSLGKSLINPTVSVKRISKSFERYAFLVVGFKVEKGLVLSVTCDLVNLLNKVDFPAHVYPINVAENSSFFSLFDLV